MMDFGIKIAWVNRIKDESGASWKIIPEQALTQYGGLSFLTNCDYDVTLLDLKNLPTVIAASYIGSERSELFDFLISSQQHGGNYMQKSAKHDGSHGAYVTESAFELHIITSLSS